MVHRTSTGIGCSKNKFRFGLMRERCSDLRLLVRTRYSGGGSLVGTDWRGLNYTAARISEELQLDPLGNVHLRRTSQGADQQNGELPKFENFHEAVELN